MVCVSNTGTSTLKVPIKDTLGGHQTSTVNLSPTKTVESLFNEVASLYRYEQHSVELSLQDVVTGESVTLNAHKDKTLGDLGIHFGPDSKYKLIITTAPNDVLLGVSVSGENEILPTFPYENCTTKNDPGPFLTFDFKYLGRIPKKAPGRFLTFGENEMTPNFPYENLQGCVPKKDPGTVEQQQQQPCNYVGLVNQAMTCYLNSLIQALYMTPEFRNALYNWEFDRSESESKSIPFQLQKLFLNLQTSTKSAVETTDLTASFGWDMQAAWEQHDIQELCRVMFDALEQKFKDTKQANLINDLYEGKMLDYVKCLECGTEKSREDTFLDIPLPVRPFGSNVAYTSIEEALGAFVQPETLDGNNQYFCEKCNKKCDAHKGLKFIKFPYLLTLHLKRFDFDYSTMHRIKLNDKVVFPKVLNLNSFIPNINNCSDNFNLEDRETVVKCDDCSTTDSGSALDYESCHGTDVSSTVNGQDDTCQDDDEGIDVSSGHMHDQEKVRQNEPRGPYYYELFSIMIHSGSASGGHYYAYIKDFQKDMWFCFNDQTVTRITEDDICKTYGGGPQRGYYSGAYTSSTNAYMLMYRQIDKTRNAKAMTSEEFPPHILELLQQMRQKEEQDRLNREKESDMFRLKFHCYHPLKRQMMEVKFYVFIDSYLSVAVNDAYHRMKLEEFCNIEDCRLVKYNKIQDCIICSFEGEKLRFCDIASKNSMQYNDWLIEVRKPGTEWQVYKPGGVNMKVFVINLENEEVDGPTIVRVNPGETVGEFKLKLAKMLNMNVNTLNVVQEMYSNEPHYLDDDDAPIKFDPSCNGYKIYISNALDEDSDKLFQGSRLQRVISRFVHLVSIDIILPATDVGTLESLSIPSLDINQNIDRLDMTDRVSNSPNMRISPQPGPSLCTNEGFGDQSNSEDSSLSDSDRTLVGDAPGDCLGLLSSSSNSPADQHMASPSDPTEDTYNPEIFGNPAEEMHWDDEVTDECSNYYFKATIEDYMNSPENYSDVEGVKCAQVLTDRRITLRKLKKHLEPILGVPMEYFKIYRLYSNNCVEWPRLNDTLRSTKDGDKLLVKLGRVLRKDEYLLKVYHFVPDNNEPFKYLFEWVVAKNQTVGQVKKEILIQAKIQHMLDIPYSKCRLRRKNRKDPSTIFMDDEKFVDLCMLEKFEVCLQELPEGEKVTKSTQVVLFIRKWDPLTYSLGPFQEVVLDLKTMDELKKKISEFSRIPVEFVEVAYVKQSFPCDMNVLCIHTDLEWNPNVKNLLDYPLQIQNHGAVFFYRDNRDNLKEITSEEKKEMHKKEKARLDRFNSRTYSPRRERALKIYVDTSPSKNEDNCTD